MTHTSAVLPVQRSAHRAAPVRVSIHAPDPISAAGVRTQLEEHPRIVVDDGGDSPGQVAVVLWDAGDAPALLRLRKLARADGTRTVLVAGLIREAELLRITELGISTVLWRHEATAQRLCQAVLTASRGEGSMPPDLIARLIAQVARLHRGGSDATVTLPGLSPREVDVIRLVADGLDTSQIAGVLSYSERTVKNVLHGMTTRLHLRNRSHAVAYALRKGYIY